MGNDKNATISIEGERITFQEENDIHLWSERFKVSPDELKRVIIDVGSNVKRVEEFINNEHHK